MKVENIKPIVLSNDVERTTNDKHKPQTSREDTLKLSQHESALLEESKALMEQMSNVDFERVEKIKQSIRAGDISFDMKELASMLAGGDKNG